MVTSTPGSSKFSGWPAVGRAELAEALDVVQRRPLVPGEVEQRVDQHRAVAGRQDEPVAVGPLGIGGIELQVPREQRRRGIGHAHRHAGMPAVRGLDRVHREGANGVGEAAVGRLHDAPLAGFGSPGSPDDVAAPLAASRERVKSRGQRLPVVANLRSGESMDEGDLYAALDRAERALQRIERALAARQPAPPRDEELRAKVREVVEELDELIREAAA